MRSTVVALVGAVAVSAMAYMAYTVGLSQGAAQAAAASGTLPPYPYAWGWYRPWGFGGFPVFVLFIVAWCALARSFFWGGPWRRRWYIDHDVPPSFEAWHRRAHERMPQEPPPAT